MKELKNLIEELKANAVEKDSRLDHLQKRSDELCTLLGEAKEVGIKEFKASSEYTDLLDKNYAARFEDFHMDALELFLEIDFSPIKLCVAVERAFFFRQVLRILMLKTTLLLNLLMTISSLVAMPQCFIPLK